MSIVRQSVLWSVSLVCLSFFLVDAPQAQGQQPGQGRRTRGFNFSGFGGSSLELLRRDDVKKELELLDEQLKQIEALREKSRNSLRDAFSGLRDLSQEERRKRFENLGETLRTRNKEVEKEVNSKILLPHQSKRLAQIRFQRQLSRSRGGSGAFTSTTVVEALGISEEQLEKLKELQSQTEQELRKQIAKLREEARKKMLNELTTQQRAKYEKLIGDPFEFSSEPSRRFGGGNNNRGNNRGGDRGRRDRSRQRPKT